MTSFSLFCIALLSLANSLFTITDSVPTITEYLSPYDMKVNDVVDLVLKQISRKAFDTNTFKNDNVLVENLKYSSAYDGSGRSVLPS